MAVVIETTIGDITVDLFTEERPRTCLNFLKLCKIKYYNFCLFHSVQHNFVAQTGDPTGLGKNGESVFGKIRGEGARFFEAEMIPKLKHTKPGLVSMVNCGDNMLGSQFFITLGSELQYLDNDHCVFGEVAEGNDVLLKLNEAICDSEHRPYQDIRITHTVILDDPFDDPVGLQIPDCSPEPSPEVLMNGRIAPDEVLDDTQGLSAVEIEEREQSREARAQATILEIVGDLPDAEMAPPENVLFVCKLNPVTSDDDLEIIFSRFGKVKSCEVIRDKVSGDSLQYAFVEFEDKKACEDAYFKMDNVLIDDRRIHVDFSQSVARLRWKGRGRGVEHIQEKAETKQDRSGRKYERSSTVRVDSLEAENRQHSHGDDWTSRENEFDRDKNNACKKGRRLDDYKCGSRQEGDREKKAARNDEDFVLGSRDSNENERKSKQSYERSGEGHRGVNKDAKSSNRNDEGKRFQDGGKDLKVKQDASKKHSSEEGKKNKDIQHTHSNGEGKTHTDIEKVKCEESHNRHIVEKDKRCRVTNKDVRSGEEKSKNIDKNITVKHNSEKNKKLAKQMEEGSKKRKDAKDKRNQTVKEKSDRKMRGESMTKETKKRKHSSSSFQSRKKHKRSPSSDSESSSSINFTSSTDSSSSESSDEQSKARHKKHHKKPSVLAKKSKKKLKLSKKNTRKRKNDSDTDSSSFDSSDSNPRGRSRNKRKQRTKGASSEEDSSSEREVKRKRRKKRKKKPKVSMKRKRKSSSSEDSETDDTSSDSEDQKPPKKRHKKVIKKRKKNHTTNKKSVQRSKSDESHSVDRKVRSSASD